VGDPKASSAAVSQRMRNTPQRDTPAELALRRELHGRGLRYLVDVAPIPGRRRADLVFRGPKVAVFIDGCFWHACPEHATFPKSNREWWADKLAANFARDRDTDRRLAEAGWRVVRVWEHVAPSDAARIVERVLRHRMMR